MHWQLHEEMQELNLSTKYMCSSQGRNLRIGPRDLLVRPQKRATHVNHRLADDDVPAKIAQVA